MRTSNLVRHSAHKIGYSAVSPGENPPSDVPLAGTPVAHELTLLLQNASQGAQWPPGEFELAVLTFQVQEDVTDAILELRVIDAQLQKDDAVTAFDALNAVLFVI